MSTPDHSLLGKLTAYPERYDASLLFSIPRAAQRAQIGLGATLPFYGEDVWNAYELSWLDARGKPVVALAQFRVPADSPAIIESKSFKLYLNGFAQERLDEATLRATLARDLSAAAGAPVALALQPPRADACVLADLAGTSLDTLAIEVDHYGPPQPEFLSVQPGAAQEQAFVSDLLRSNCPVTGQPDWGSVRIACFGPPIDPAGLLRYLVSFRTHSDFHEHCVERIYMDLTARCAPQRLSVDARYTRRGGLDINPFRSSEAAAAPSFARGARQ